jgi:hypothetical protein
MKISELINYLRYYEGKFGSDMDVTLMMEVDEPEVAACQYEFPLTSVATDKKRVILMHERWGPKD